MLVRSQNLSDAILAELPEMRAFARLMVNDRHQADDEVAAALTLAMSTKDGLHGRGGLYSRGGLRLSLFTILRKCIAHHDHKPSSNAQAVFPAEEDSAETSVSGIIREPLTAIDKAIMQLSSQEREAIILSIAAEFSDREIAIICECSIPEVESRLHGADKALRRKSKSAPLLLHSLMSGFAIMH